MGWLSNFSRFIVTYEGLAYPTSEHLYQALKFTDSASRERIRLTPKPMEAARLGRTLPGMRADWDSVKLAVMEEVLWLKLDQNPYLKEKLLATGEAEIIEDATWDSWWGCGADGKGRNELGKLWQKIRTELCLREKEVGRKVKGN